MSLSESKILTIIKNRLKDMPGLEIILDTRSKIRYSKEYAYLLLESPGEAYKLLVEVMGGSKSSATMVLEYLLQPLVKDSRQLELALKKLEEDDDDSLIKRILLIEL